MLFKSQELHNAAIYLQNACDKMLVSNKAKV